MRRLCQTLKVHPSGYYAWLTEFQSVRAQEDQRLFGLIKHAWLESGGVYGYRKIHDDLRHLGETCGRNRVRRLMQAEELRSQTGCLNCEDSSVENLLSDWCAFCEGKNEFDKSHFLGLLKDFNTNEDLRMIFGYFPFAETLVGRAASVIESGRSADSLYLLPDGEVNECTLVRLGGEWLKAQENISEALGVFEITEICRSAKVLFVDQQKLERALEQDIPHYWLFDEIGDAIRSSKISESDQVYALFEALYGLAADYYLAWYIARPLFAVDIDLEPYYKFWRAGGRCALTESEFLVSI